MQVFDDLSKSKEMGDRFLEMWEGQTPLSCALALAALVKTAEDDESPIFKGAWAQAKFYADIEVRNVGN